MDFSAFEVAETAKMEILHPESGEPIKDSEGLTPWIELSGNASKAHRKALFHLKRRVLREMKASAGEVEDEADHEEVFFARSEEAELDMLANLTVAWGGIKLNGETLDCTPDNARMFYERFPFVRNQVDRFISASSNFMPASSKS